MPVDKDIKGLLLDSVISVRILSEANNQANVLFKMLVVVTLGC